MSSWQQGQGLAFLLLLIPSLRCLPMKQFGIRTAYCCFSLLAHRSLQINALIRRLSRRVHPAELMHFCGWICADHLCRMTHGTGLSVSTSPLLLLENRHKPKSSHIADHPWLAYLIPGITVEIPGGDHPMGTLSYGMSYQSTQLYRNLGNGHLFVSETGPRSPCEYGSFSSGVLLLLCA